MRCREHRVAAVGYVLIDCRRSILRPVTAGRSWRPTAEAIGPPIGWRRHGRPRP